MELPSNESDQKPVLTYFLESKNESMLNPLCYQADDEYFGKRILGGFALEIIDNGHPCHLLTYDNGDQYLYDKTEKMLYRLGKLEPERMIHKYLEKKIYDCADEHLIPIRRPFYCAQNEVDALPLIRLLINPQIRVVYITNILVPWEKRHRNIGKDLISQIYNLCSTHGFRLILLDVVPHFLESLRSRNAIVNDEEDSVEITNKTDLKSHFA